jgi:nitroreductase
MEICLETSSPLNNFHNQIHAHRSIRSYANRAVEPATLERVLSAATRASSSGNMQAYSIIVTSDRELREKLYRPHFEQSMVLDAPVLLTFCADFRRMRRWLALREAPDNFDNFMSFMIATIDAVLASQNAALAAEVEGLGICYMGTTLANCFEIAEILQCPPGVVPIVGFSIGHPAENPAPRDRLPLDLLVHRECYQDPSDEKLLAGYHEREVSGWKRYMVDPQLRARTEEAGVRNLAQVYTQLKYTRESHQEYSQTVLACLKKQGFLTDLDVVSMG